MPTNVLVTFYSTYGHTHKMAQAVQEGAAGVSDVEVRLTRIPELEAARQAMQGQDAYQQAQEAMSNLSEVTHDDLRWADGIIWGTPTRYGNMTAQMKQFIDTTGPLWQKGELEDKATGHLYEHRDHPRRAGIDHPHIISAAITLGDDFCGHALRSEPANHDDRGYRRLSLRPGDTRGRGRLEAARRRRTHHRS